MGFVCPYIKKERFLSVFNLFSVVYIKPVFFITDIIFKTFEFVVENIICFLLREN